MRSPPSTPHLESILLQGLQVGQVRGKLLEGAALKDTLSCLAVWQVAGGGQCTTHSLGLRGRRRGRML